MNLNIILWFFEKFKKDSLSLLYTGHFSEEILRKVMDLSEIKISTIESFKKKKKKMLFIMAEGFQNIIKHGEKPEVEGNNKNFFLTLSRENAIYISTGNLIESNNVGNLQKQLIEVNSLDEQGLKDLHSYVMKHGSISQKGGAGLGLIAVARKSDQKLNYSFEKYSDEFSFYYNQIVLQAETENAENSTKSVLSIDESIEYHHKMINEDILLIQKGDFSHESIEQVLQIVENNLQKEIDESDGVKVFYNTLQHVLENIDKHGLEIEGNKDGIFLLSRQDSNFVINSGNYIADDKIEALKNRIDLLNKEKEEKKLGENNERGIGFIEIAKASKFPLKYSFEKIDETKCFFSLRVIL